MYPNIRCDIFWCKILGSKQVVALCIPAVAALFRTDRLNSPAAPSYLCSRSEGKSILLANVQLDLHSHFFSLRIDGALST